MHHVHAMICLLFSSQNHVPTPIVSFSTDAQYSKDFQRSGECSYVFLEWIATYIHREGKTKINFFYIFLLLEHFSTYVVVFICDKDLFWKRAIQKSRIELYNLSIYIYMIFSQQEQDIFYWNFCFLFFFGQALSQSSSTFRATILRYFCNVASQLACKPHLGEIQ